MVDGNLIGTSIGTIEDEYINVQHSGLENKIYYSKAEDSLYFDNPTSGAVKFIRLSKSPL
ncbi:hypothetical protein D3C80_1817030 [compost metagenome]